MFTYDKIQSLNELELSLYDYIAKNSEKVSYMRIRELANEAHVSTTTILRFCKKMNCEGFSEFKVKLKMNIEQEATKEITDNTAMLIDFFKRVDTKEFQEKIDKVCELIADSTNVLFIGIGFSGILAKYAARYLSAVGKFAIYMDDPFYPSNCKHKDTNVALVFSVSGETEAIIGHINSLKKDGIKTVSLTNNEGSIIAKLSDINISYYIQQDKIGEYDITTQVPVLYIIETIGKRLYNLNFKYKI